MAQGVRVEPQPRHLRRASPTSNGLGTQAAEQATQTSVEATYDETTLARELCEAGTRFIPASAEQLDALHDAVAPVIDGLAADPNNADLLADIQALAAEYPDTEVPDVPADCQQPAHRR